MERESNDVIARATSHNVISGSDLLHFTVEQAEEWQTSEDEFCSIVVNYFAVCSSYLCSGPSHLRVGIARPI